MVGVPPHRDLKRYDHLREIGVNRVSFCFEIFDRDLFREICPGKDREYGLDHYLEAVRYCATLGERGPRDEPWVSNGEIIAGLEPVESSIAAIDWITSVGAIPTVCLFRPLRGTDLEVVEPPKTEDMIPVYRRLWEATMEAGLPIGVAPDIHVSLVMLPEECRWLSPRRYRWQSLSSRRCPGCSAGTSTAASPPAPRRRRRSRAAADQRRTAGMIASTCRCQPRTSST